MCLCVYVLMCVCVYVCMCLCVYVYVCMYSTNCHLSAVESVTKLVW